MANKLAIVTGASTGIGLELAKLAAADGYDLLIAADEPRIHDVAREIGNGAVSVDAVEADLATDEGNDKLIAAARGRPIDALFANAGRGLGHAFIDQDVAEWRRVIDTNVFGTSYIVQKVAQQMKARNEGKILITGSIAGLMPGSFQAVYNGTKAYLDSFAYALRDELKDTALTITVLMPGPTDTPFFERGHLMDTQVGQDDSKEDPALTAKHGYDALMAGKAHVVSGWKNKVQAALSHVVPDSVLAGMHRSMAEPGSGKA